MLERFFQNSKVFSQLKQFSFGSTIDYLAEYLSKRRYSFRTTKEYLRAAGHFSYWLKKNQMVLKSVNEAIVNRFLGTHFKQCNCPVAKGGSLQNCRAALKHFLEVLRDRRLIPFLKTPTSISPVDNFLEDFRRHLEEVNGLALSTIKYYSRHVGEFLRVNFEDGILDFDGIDAGSVREYVANKAMGIKTRTAKSLTVSLGALFRFLWITKQIKYPLEGAIPTIPYRKLSNLPKYLTEDQSQSLLSSFDVSTPIGLRDYAITLIIARMGIRSCEVAQLTLNDINWKQAEIHLKKTKPRYASSLPLTKEVGKAIVKYLQNGRPLTEERHIFVTHNAPVGRALSASGVRKVVAQAFKRCNFPIASRGTNLLRRTLATQLLQKGATLKEIADIFRHRNIETTNIYTKVDLKSLATVALPWPEVSL